MLYSSMTAALEGGEGSAAHPGCTLPHLGKTRYPFYRRLGGPQCWSGWAENLVLTGIVFLIMLLLLPSSFILIHFLNLSNDRITSSWQINCTCVTRLMIELDQHEDSYLATCKHYRAVLNTSSVQEDADQRHQVLQNVVLYLVLAPYDNEQADLTHRVLEDKLLEEIPVYR